LAFRAGCKAVRDAALHGVCIAAADTLIIDDDQARQFFERHFRVETLPGEGVLTGYFAPVYTARTSRDGEYSAPVRPPPPPTQRIQPPPPPNMDSFSPAKASDRPGAADGDPAPDLPTLSVAQTDTAPSETDRIGALLDDPAPVPTNTAPNAPSSSPGPPEAIPLREAERALIEQAPADDAIAWMRPEDLFLMQIQGSGVLVFPDGRRRRAAYAGDNGKPFVAIARVMVKGGLLPQNGVSGDGIRRWLSAHAGVEADEIMRKNPRYVFFQMVDDAAGEPLGAAGTPLPPGRAIAMDRTHHAFGVPYWIDAEAPILAGASVRYHRLAIALDTGGAIRGPIRADLYFGTGDAAGREAGRVRHVLRLARLVPVDQNTSESDDASATRSARR
jgi:membrane-bound lytic murein transglycosylase A